MNKQSLSQKSREELNGSLLTLYRKLTDKPVTKPDQDKNKSGAPSYSEKEMDHPDQEEELITPAIGIGI